MKSKSIGSLIFLAIVAPNCGGGGGGDDAPPRPPNLVKWQTQQRVPTSSDLHSVIFADATHGIIAGKDGSFFRTDDGGVTWTQQEFSPPNRSGDVTALSALGFTLVAVGPDAANGLARSWTGSHDSVSWVTPDVAATGPVYVDVNVSDGGFGNTGGTWWMLRSDGVIDYVFQAVGGSFTTVNAAPTQPGCPIPPVLPVTWTQANGVIFIGSTGTGFVCGTSGAYAGNPGCPAAMPPVPAVPAHGAIGQIIVTTDFGSRWKVQDITTTMTVVRRMFITHTQGGLARGYAIGDETLTKGRLLVTNFDLPDRWDLVPNDPGTLPVLHGLSFPENDLTGWVVGNNGTIYKVTATAVFTPPVPGTPGNPMAMPPIPPTPPIPGFWTYTYAWTLQPVAGVNQTLWSISMIDNNNGYIVGDGGLVLKMTGGGPWTKISKGDAGINLNAASFTDNGVKGLAVGNAVAGNVAKIYRTLDGGTTWTSMATGPVTTQNLLSVSVPRTGIGGFATISGDGGTLIRNADVWGVGAWSAATGTNAADTYSAVLFPLDETKGVCVGSTNAGRKILQTTDGVAFSLAALPVTPASSSYTSLAANPGGSKLFAAGGTNGIISLSTDLGATWNDIASPGGGLSFFSLSSPDAAAYTAFAAANDNRVWRMSTPAPQTWAPTANPWGAVNPVSLGFQGGFNGVTVLANGQIYYTEDGGATWLRSYPHTKDQPRAIWMSLSVFGLGYVVANDGTILKTVSAGH